MNREIKFRARENLTGKIIYSDFIFGRLPTFFKRVDDGEYELLGQFTGLKDKNGKEIYEGDIVEWDDYSDGKWRRRCVVGYEFGHYTLKGYHYSVHDENSPKKPVEFKFGAFAYEEETEKELEVIGNIWENENLINPIS